MMNAEDPNKVLNIFETILEANDEPKVEFLRVSIFYLSNFPSSYYTELDLEKLDYFFRIISKNIS